MMRDLRYLHAVNEALHLPKDTKMKSSLPREQEKRDKEALLEIFKTISAFANKMDLKEIDITLGDLRKYKRLPEIERSYNRIIEIYNRYYGVNESKINGKKDRTEQLGRELLFLINDVINRLRNYSSVFEMGYMLDDFVIISLYRSMVLCIGSSLTSAYTLYLYYGEDGDDITIEINEKGIEEFNKSVEVDTMKRFCDLCDNRHLETYRGIMKDYHGNKYAKIVEYEKEQAYNQNPTNEAFGTFQILSTAPAVNATFPLWLVVLAISPLIIWKIVPIVREMFYMYYGFRKNLSDELDFQATLISVNIESLPSNTPRNKRIITKQKKIATMLKKISTKINIDRDGIVAKSKRAINVENHKLSNDLGVVVDNGKIKDSGMMI